MLPHKGSPLRQLTLNFGQKSPVASHCRDCGMIFNSLSKEDIQMHEKHHRLEKSDSERALNYSSSLLKSENLVQKYVDGKCVVISADTATKPLLTKAFQVLSYVDQDLGIHETPQKAAPMTKFYLFVSSQTNKIQGFCLAEPIKEAYWSTGSGESLSYDEKTPEKGRNLCGISRIWVSGQARRRGIATRLLECVCANFFYVIRLEPRQLAFSDPTQYGQSLARSFTKSESFLVYKYRQNTN